MKPYGYIRTDYEPPEKFGRSDLGTSMPTFVEGPYQSLDFFQGPKALHSIISGIGCVLLIINLSLGVGNIFILLCPLEE